MDEGRARFISSNTMLRPGTSCMPSSEAMARESTSGSQWHARLRRCRPFGSMQMLVTSRRSSAFVTCP